MSGTHHGGAESTELPPPEEPMSYSVWVKQRADYHRAIRRQQARNANGKHLGRRGPAPRPTKARRASRRR